MRKTYGDQGLNDWDSAQIGDRQQASLISNAEQNISSSCQNIENAFKDINHDFDAPCPVNLVRRLAVLEIALGQLRQDCEIISAKRKNIVQSVIAHQNESVKHMRKIMSTKNLESSSGYRRQDSVETNWNALSLEMKRQLDLL